MLSEYNPSEEKDDSFLHYNGHQRLRTLLQNDKCPFRLVVTDPSQHYDGSTQEKDSVTHVKTLIWEATKIYDQNINQAGESIIDDEEKKEKFCFVTATKVSDKVDEKILQQIISSTHASATFNHNKNGAAITTERYDIQLAETNLAERLTGYTSGTIPPFGHIVPMLTLYMDESILLTPKASSSSTVSIGSGSVGYDIELNTTDFMRVAQKTTRCTVCSIVTQPKEGKQQPRSTGSIHMDSSNNMDNRKVLNEDAVNKNEKMNTKVRGDTSSSNNNISTTKGRKKEQSELRVPPKSLSKRLRDAAGKSGKAHEVGQILQEAGSDFPNLVTVGGHTDGNYTKNALHLAAWKGDLESVRLIVKAGQSYGLPDLVNIISQGEGNYGKTPIFYALTQCRDDCVLLLAQDLEANLLIVNNKGQTPCSMASSHLKPSTCEMLYKIEAQQLEAGGSFINYRISNSDHKRYGDLDPRFSIDDDNRTPELDEELRAYHQFLQDKSNAIEYDSRSGLPIGIGFPRSLRQTTREIRYAKGMQYRKNNNNNNDKGKQQMDDSTPNILEGTSTASAATYIRTIRPGLQNGKKGISTKRNKTPSPSPPTVDVTKFDCLELKDIFVTSTEKPSQDPFVVHDMDGVHVLAQAIEEAVQRADAAFIDSSISYPPDDIIARFAWGLDCEWKPSRDKGRDNPVATLQLSTPTQAFLVDLQELCQPSIRIAQHEMTNIETLLSSELEKLFANEYIAIVGFGIGQDLSKMAMSFPHLPCFRLFESVIDVQMLARSVYSNYRKDYVNSLQKAVAITMNKRLDKTEQCSDWQQRPLSSAQIVYAVLDAVVSRHLLTIMLKKLADNSNIDERTYENGFYQKNSHLRQTVSLQYLGCIEMESSSFLAPPPAYRVPMGAIKKVLNLRFTKQTWPTGKQAPPPPELIPLSEMNRVPMGKKNRKDKKKIPSSTSESEDDLDNGDTEDLSSISKSSKRGKGISLRSLCADFDELPTPGSSVGFTKDSCVNCCIGYQLLNSMPSDIKIRYNRWGGVIAMANSWLLFINFKGHGEWKYRNEFSDDGRYISFSVNPGRPQEELLLNFITGKDSNNDGEDCTSRNEDSRDMPTSEQKILLFIRPSTREKFLFCGECQCVEVRVSDEDVMLDLELLDYATLMSIEDSSFRNLL